MRWMMLAALAALAGCSLTPALKPTALPVPAAYPFPQPAMEGAFVVADVGWKAMFGDPRLRRLIELALDHNRDLRLAALNVDAVGAQYRIQHSSQWPGIAAEASSVRERAGTGGQGVGQDGGVPTRHAVGLGLSAFEIDLFGRLRALMA